MNKHLFIKTDKFNKNLNIKDSKSMEAFVNAFIDGKFKILTKLNEKEKRNFSKLNLEEGLDLEKINKAMVEVAFTNAVVASKDYIIYLDPVKGYLDKGNLNMCLNNVFLEEDGIIRHVSVEEILHGDLLSSHDLVALRSLFKNNNEINFVSASANNALPYVVCSVFASYSEISESASKYNNIISISNNVIYYLKKLDPKPQPGELYLHEKGRVYKIIDADIKMQINDAWEDAVLYELDEREEINSSNCKLKFVRTIKDFVKSFTKCKR